MVQVSATMSREEPAKMGKMVDRVHLAPNEADLKHERCDIEIRLKGQLGAYMVRKTKKGPWVMG